jgi:hypothetical protein
MKSSGFLQAWTQKKLSVPTYRVSAAYGWDASTGTSSTQQAFNADVYVFCLHTAKSHDEYDPLKISQWRFYVAGRPVIEAQAGAQMGLATLARIAGEPVTYADLRISIAAAAAGDKPPLISRYDNSSGHRRTQPMSHNAAVRRAIPRSRSGHPAPSSSRSRRICFHLIAQQLAAV